MTARCLVAAAALVACTPTVPAPLGEDRAVAPTRGGTLHVASFVDLRSLDPAVGYDTVSAAVQFLIFDRLLAYDAKGQLEPQLAESYDVAPDGLSYTFHLRRGVRFQDGSDLTATDVKRSLERTLHHDTPCPAPSYYDHLRGYADYHEGKTTELPGIRVAGSHTVVFELSEPDSVFPHLLAMTFAAPVCPGAGATYDARFSLAACGAGPFKLVRFRSGDGVRVERHEAYWRPGAPLLDAIDWQLAVPQFAQRFKFERGDLDYIREFSEADSVLYRSSPAWRGRGAWEPSMSVNGLFMNTEMPPFDDVHLRRAVAAAIDRTELAAVRPGHVTPHDRILPTGLVPSHEGRTRQLTDRARALEEMRLAGYPYDPTTGRGGYPHTLRFLSVQNSFGQTSSELFQQQLARIGIRLELELVGFPTYLARSGERRSVAIGWDGWNADYPEPSTFFGPILTTAAIADEDSQNHSFFSNRELDDLIAQARKSTDPAARDELYRRAEALVSEQAPWAVAYEAHLFELWQPYVHGYAPNPIQSQYLRGAWIDVEARRAAPLARRAARPRTTLAWTLARWR